MIDPVTGKDILPGADRVAQDVKKTLEDRVSELEAKFEKARKVLVAVTGHTEPLSLG